MIRRRLALVLVVGLMIGVAQPALSASDTITRSGFYGYPLVYQRTMDYDHPYPSGEGFYITRVAGGSRAQQGGLERGQVIRTINDEPVRTHADILRIINDAGSDTVSMLVAEIAPWHARKIRNDPFHEFDEEDIYRTDRYTVSYERKAPKPITVYHSAGSPLFHRGGYAHSPKPGASDTYPNPREAREAGLERCPICFPEDGGGIVGRLIQEQVGGAGDFVEQLKSKHPTVQEVPTELRTLLVRLFRQRLRQRINPRMVLIEADKFHGFGLENGTIMLSEGLLRLMESELETAAQVAHQMAHMDLRHDASAVQTSRLQSLIEQAINRTTSVDFTFQDLKEYSPNIPGFQYYSELIQQGYGEPQERQAAFFAMVYLYRAGFDMKGVAQIMRKRADMESGVHPRWLEYVLKHPYPSDVQTRIRQWSRRIPKAFERNLSP